MYWPSADMADFWYPCGDINVGLYGCVGAEVVAKVWPAFVESSNRLELDKRMYFPSRDDTEGADKAPAAKETGKVTCDQAIDGVTITLNTLLKFVKSAQERRMEDIQDILR